MDFDLYIKQKESTKQTIRMEKNDKMISSERYTSYDRLARNYHHPSYRDSFVNHYDELFRFNLAFHELNHPAPPKRSKLMSINPPETLQSTKLTRTMSASIYLIIFSQSIKLLSK